MLKRDYILAIIQELIQAIARAIGLFRKGENKKALSLVDECYRILKIDRRETEECTPDRIIPFLLEEYLLDKQLLESMGDLFCAQAEAGDENRTKYLRFAQNIYRFLDETERTYSLPRIQKLARVDLLLSDLNQINEPGE